MSDRNEAYARALLEVARADGRLTDVEDELYRFARTVEGNDELRTALADAALPLPRRVGVVEDLLGGGRALATTTALATMIVAAERASDLGDIVDRFVTLAAAGRDHAVAEVRTAVPLTDEQRTRLTAALAGSTRQQIEIKEITDPAVVGGVHVRIGDRVIDGTVRHRIDQLKGLI